MRWLLWHYAGLLLRWIYRWSIHNRAWRSVDGRPLEELGQSLVARLRPLRMSLARLHRSPLLHSPGAGQPLTRVDDPLTRVLRLLRTSRAPGHLRPLLLTNIVMKPR